MLIYILHWAVRALLRLCPDTPIVANVTIVGTVSAVNSRGAMFISVNVISMHKERGMDPMLAARKTDAIAFAKYLAEKDGK